MGDPSGSSMLAGFPDKASFAARALNVVPTMEVKTLFEKICGEEIKNLTTKTDTFEIGTYSQFALMRKNEILLAARVGVESLGLGSSLSCRPPSDPHALAPSCCRI
jgi:hypothetical protein